MNYGIYRDIWKFTDLKEMYMMKIIKTNCRTDKKCVFCKYWLGMEPEVDYRSGSAKYLPESAYCPKNKDMQCQSNGICSDFTKALQYM